MLKSINYKGHLNCRIPPQIQIGLVNPMIKYDLTNTILSPHGSRDHFGQDTWFEPMNKNTFVTNTWWCRTTILSKKTTTPKHVFFEVNEPPEPTRQLAPSFLRRSQGNSTNRTTKVNQTSMINSDM